MSKAGVNKSAMVKFIVEHWMQTATGCPIMLYVKTEKSCSRLVLSQDQPPMCEVVPALTTAHEEADTRLIMHAVQASEQFRAVIIDSVDADVGVMALGHSKKFLCEQLALLTGKSENKRLIDLTAVSKTLGERMIEALIGLHAFTGCTSGFVMKGKKTHYKLVKSDPKCLQAMEALGKSFEPTESLLSLCEYYTCKLYNDHGGENINKLRYGMFVTKSGASASLPPCQDSLHEHTKRSDYGGGPTPH